MTLPQALACWEEGTHERNLYSGTVNGSHALVCRQLDDFAVACADPAIAEQLIAKINDQVTTDSKGLGEKTAAGIFVRYNGLDVLQCCQQASPDTF